MLIFNFKNSVGRTARAGRSGLAISLITPNDLVCLGAIEEKIKTKLTEYKIDGILGFVISFII